MAAGVGTGATLKFPDPTAYPLDVLNIEVSDIERETVETSHLGTTVAKTHLETPLYDGGIVEVDLHLEPVTLNTAKPPGVFDNVHGTLKITLPSGATFSAAAKAIGYGFTVPLQEKMVARARFKISGAITFTNGS
jgi:hypothetical protein